MTLIQCSTCQVENGNHEKNCPQKREEEYWKKNDENQKLNREKLIRKELLDQIEKLIIDEILIARHEGQPTSRLTSLAMKINKLKG